MPDHGFAPAYKKINYPDRQRRDMSLKSASMISLTTRPLSAPSLEFVDTAPGTRGAGARPPPPRGPRERPARRYNLPSIFAPSNSHQVKRLGSSWAYSTGRTKSRARRVVAFIRERPSKLPESRNLDRAGSRPRA